MKVILPLFVVQEYKTKKPRKRFINLNNYRNWHRIIEHQIKVTYQEACYKELNKLNLNKFSKPINIHYILYVWDLRIKDTNNVLSIVDKYFSDALVELWIIDDDNYNFIKNTINSFGWYDRWKWRIEIYFNTIDLFKTKLHNGTIQ